MGALCLLLFNRLRTALATAQLLHTTAQIFLCVEAGSDLDSISDDIPGAAHLTDTFHFLCPCATLSALVHAQTTLTLASANTEAVNEHKSLIPRTDPTCTMWCPCLSFFSFFARQRVTEWKGQTCSSPTNSTPTGDSASQSWTENKGANYPLNSGMGQGMKLLLRDAWGKGKYYFAL